MSVASVVSVVSVVSGNMKMKDFMLLLPVSIIISTVQCPCLCQLQQKGVNAAKILPCRPMEEETSQMSHLGLTNMTWTSLNLNLSLVRGQEEEVNQKVEEEVEGNSTSLNRLDTGLVYEAVVQV